MSLILDGVSDCNICHKAFLAGEHRITFGPLVEHNASTSPLRFFSQRTFHTKCVEGLPTGLTALEEQCELDQVPRRSQCSICGLRIVAPENISTSELVRFYEYEAVTVPRDAAIPAMLPAIRNGQHFHRTCLMNAGRFVELVASVERLMAKGWDPFAARHWLRALDPLETEIKWLKQAQKLEELLRTNQIAVAQDLNCPRCRETPLDYKLRTFDEPISTTPLIHQDLFFLKGTCHKCNMWVAGVQYLAKNSIPMWVNQLDEIQDEYSG